MNANILLIDRSSTLEAHFDGYENDRRVKTHAVLSKRPASERQFSARLAHLFARFRMRDHSHLTVTMTIQTAKRRREFFNAIPELHVQSVLTLTRDRNRDASPDRNDLKDLFFLEVAHPYAEFVVTENNWGHIWRASKISAHYGTQVVSLEDLPQVLEANGCYAPPSRTLVRDLPDSWRRNATPSDRTRTLVAARSPRKFNERSDAEVSLGPYGLSGRGGSADG